MQFAIYCLTLAILTKHSNIYRIRQYCYDLVMAETVEAYETDLNRDCGLRPIPEQSTILLLSVGLLTLMGYVSYTWKKEQR